MQWPLLASHLATCRYFWNKNLNRTYTNHHFVWSSLTIGASACLPRPHVQICRFGVTYMSHHFMHNGSGIGMSTLQRAFAGSLVKSIWLPTPIISPGHTEHRTQQLAISPWVCFAITYVDCAKHQVQQERWRLAAATKNHRMHGISSVFLFSSLLSMRQVHK